MVLLLTLAWRTLWRHPTRTLLTASVVALGLACLLVMLGLGDGSHRQMIDAAARTGSGHVLLQAADYQRRRAVDAGLDRESAARAVAWARAQPGVEAVLPRALASALLSSADGATGVGLVGVDPAAEATASRFAARIAAGRFLEPGDRRVAVLGRGVARRLAVRPGSRIVAMAQGARGGEIRSILLAVGGVVHMGLEELDQGLLLVPLATAQELLDLDGGVHQVALLLEDQDRAGAVAARARRALPGAEALTWADADPELDASIRLDDGGHYLFNGIFFVVIGFMVLNTLLMSVLERRRELALLGALGLSPARRLALVTLEGTLMGLLAVGAGLLLGWSAHTYFRLHGLPLAWLVGGATELSELSGVVLDPIMRSSLSAGRLAGSAGLVLGLTVVLALVAARHAARRVDPGLLR